METNRIIIGDALSTLKTIPDNSIQVCVTSPPYYGLRDYEIAGQLGQEPSPADFVAKLVEVFSEVRRVLKPDGTLWLNLGDSYAGSGKGAMADGTPTGGNKKRTSAGTQTHGFVKTIAPGYKPKDLIGIPWRVAFALQDDGWYLRQEIIWHKLNPMPESVKDRCTKAHETIFLLAKSARYYFDYKAIQEPGAASAGKHSHRKSGSIDTSHVPGASPHTGLHKKGSPREYLLRNKRSVWALPLKPYKGAHFATFPTTLIEPCIRAGSRTGDLVLDPFSGAGTTALVAKQLGRQYIGIELNPTYAALSEKRLAG